jgi:hypothetical protein
MQKVLTVLFSFTCAAVFSQGPAIEWQKNLGGSGFDDLSEIQPTPDGGYIMLAETSSYDFDVINDPILGWIADCWLVKLDHWGNIEWQKILGGSLNDYASDLLQTPDGGYIVLAGSQSSDGDLTSNQGSADFWVVKTNSSGEIEWQNSYGSLAWEAPVSIVPMDDGGYILGGQKDFNDGDITTNYGAYDCWVIKINATGNLEWQKTFGGTGEEGIGEIQKTTDGGCIIVGYTNSSDGDVTSVHGYNDAWVIKIDAAGNLQWQKTFGGTNDEIAYSVQQTTDGGYAICGTTNSADGDVTVAHGREDSWVFKLDATGNLEWQKTFGGTEDDATYRIKKTSDNGYIIGGITRSADGDITQSHGLTELWAVKLNVSGDMMWQEVLGGSGYERAYCVNQTNDGGYILGGGSTSIDGNLAGNYTNPNYNYGFNDIWIVKLAPDFLSVKYNESQSFKITPNPTNATINFELPELKTIDQMTITDFLGKKVAEQFSNTNKINVESLAAGTYIVTVFSGDERFQSKFIKL